MKSSREPRALKGRRGGPVSRGKEKGSNYFIFDETIGMKWLIKTLYQMVNRFIPKIFRCNRPLEIVISKRMKRYLDKTEIPFYYKDIINPG